MDTQSLRLKNVSTVSTMNRKSYAKMNCFLIFELQTKNIFVLFNGSLLYLTNENLFFNLDELCWKNDCVLMLGINIWFHLVERCDAFLLSFRLWPLFNATKDIRCSFSERFVLFGRHLQYLFDHKTRYICPMCSAMRSAARI